MYSIKLKILNFSKTKLQNILSLFFLIAFLIISNSCTEECNPVDCGNDVSNNSIKGSGYLVTESRELVSFNAVHIATAGLVNLTQGDSQSVDVTVDDNLMEYIRLTVSNKILVIDIEPGNSLKNMHLTIDISLPELKLLQTSSAGCFVGKNTFNCNDLNIFSSSAGNIFLNLNANHLYTNLSSAGNASLSGTVSTHDAIISSAGGLHAFSLNTDTTTISLSSAGNAEVFVSDVLNATLSSAGSLFYKGNPVINATVSSMGVIVNAN